MINGAYIGIGIIILLLVVVLIYTWNNGNTKNLT